MISWLGRVQIPKYLTISRSKGTVERFFYHLVFVEIDFCCNPHTERVTTNTSLRCSPCKNNYFFTIASKRALNQKRNITFVISISALSAKNPFKTKTISITDVQFCITNSRPGCKMDSVRRCHQFVGKGINIINCLTGTYSTFKDVVCICSTVANVLLMRFSEIKWDPPLLQNPFSLSYRCRFRHQLHSNLPIQYYRQHLFLSDN